MGPSRLAIGRIPGRQLPDRWGRPGRQCPRRQPARALGQAPARGRQGGPCRRRSDRSRGFGSPRLDTPRGTSRLTVRSGLPVVPSSLLPTAAPFAGQVLTVIAVNSRHTFACCSLVLRLVKSTRAGHKLARTFFRTALLRDRPFVAAARGRAFAFGTRNPKPGIPCCPRRERRRRPSPAAAGRSIGNPPVPRAGDLLLQPGYIEGPRRVPAAGGDDAHRVRAGSPPAPGRGYLTQ
jgi:hypothetical protein